MKPLVRFIPYRKRSWPAQALLEFALVITLFMFLLVAVFEFGHLLLAYTMTAAGVREAARYGAASGLSESGVPRYADCDGIRAAALRLGVFAGMEPSDIVIQYDHGPGTAVYATCPPPEVALGDRIQVQATTTFSPWMLDWGTFSLHSQVERTILNAIPLDAPSDLEAYEPTPTPSPTPEGEDEEPPAPVNPTASATDWGESGRCADPTFAWEAHPLWTSPVVSYQVRHIMGGVLSPTVCLAEPPYQPDLRLDDGESITFEVWATFADGQVSQVLQAPYRCWNGSLEALP